MKDNKDINYAETFKIIGGRRFLNEENNIYYLPNDVEEYDRANLEHNIFRYAWQGNFSSKIHERLIKGDTKVIDLGCGSGSWLIDMSLKYPLSTFIGIDICQTHFSSKPNNVAFLQHNLLDGIPFPDKTFDYVFMRSMSFDAINTWPVIINEIVRVADLKGCIELMNYDLDKGIYKGPILNRIHTSARHLLYKDNIKFLGPAEMIGLISRTNKVSDIQLEEKSIPLGWGGKLGELTLMSLIMVYKSFKPFLPPIMKITEEEYDDMLNNLVNECLEYKPLYHCYRVWGIKR